MRRYERSRTRLVIFQLQIAVIVFTWTTRSFSTNTTNHFNFIFQLNKNNVLALTLFGDSRIGMREMKLFLYIFNDAHKNIIMNYDLWCYSKHLCFSLLFIRCKNETQGGATRRARASEGLLCMNYDDAGAPSAVISLWICWAPFAHWLTAHPPRLSGNASGGLFYSFIEIQLCTLQVAMHKL